MMNQKRKTKNQCSYIRKRRVLCTNCWQILEVNCTSEVQSWVITFVIIEILMLVIKIKIDDEDPLAGFDPIVFEFTNKWKL